MANRGPTAEAKTVNQAIDEGVETNSCVHHWIIESPSGRTSAGICRVCGAQRDFQNYVSDFIWEGDSTESYQSGGWRKPVTEIVRPGGEEKEDESSSFTSRGRGSKLFL
jgi:hypothetical protein